MNAQTEGAIPTAGSVRGDGFWQRALSGIAPRVVVIIALLLLAPTFGSGAISEPVAAAEGNHLGTTCFFETLVVYPPLVVLWATMLITIVATGNLGP